MKIACVWGFAVLATVTPMSVAQSLNIDFGPAGSPVPANSYGGAISQAGVWNQTAGLSEPLVALDGSPTATVVKYRQVGSRSLPELPSGDRELMQDYFYGIENDAFVVENLSSAWYTICVYAWGGFNKNINTCRMDVRETSSNFSQYFTTTFTHAWTGQEENVTFIKFNVYIEDGGIIEIISRYNGGGGETQYPNYFNGMQIVQIPAPGVVACVPALLTIAARRRRPRLAQLLLSAVAVGHSRRPLPPPFLSAAPPKAA